MPVQLDAAARFPRRNKRKQETRARIVTVAQQLFADLGYQDATMAAIAQAADVHVTTLFTHFKNKRDLTEALAEASLVFLRNIVAANQGRTPFFVFYRELVTRAAAVYDKDAANLINLGLRLQADPEILPVWLHYQREQVALFTHYLAADFGLDPTVDRRPSLVVAMLITGNVLSYEEWLDRKDQTELATLAAVTLDAAEALLGPGLHALGLSRPTG